MRIAADTGGTFTDLVVEDGSDVRLFKAATTPQDPAAGILDAVALAAADYQRTVADFLAATEVFIHATTRAINAILTDTTAKTALLTTRGHRDVLWLREGGRVSPFDWSSGYPDPYIPRSLTFEVPERVGAAGEIVQPLDVAAADQILGRIVELGVQAVAVCLLWSIANPAHELALGELLERRLPGVPYTLSHILNPTLREYRRASSTAIDASLKPVMSGYLSGLEARLRDAGFGGRLLVVTSSGGVVDAADVAAAPILAINSGPAMAPVAGRHYALCDFQTENAVVADTGGTSYDVTLVRRGRIPVTRDTWLGAEHEGHIVGFPTVDVRSVGAGGGSIAWIDTGGLLHVGPQSAGADPGPVCYGRGGSSPTVTDACVVLGYIDPGYFLGGQMRLNADAATSTIEARIARPLGLAVHEAAAAVMAVATERMVQAIEGITVDQGVDPRSAALVGGGGAAGLNAVAIARRLGSPCIVIPDAGAVLSARGALMSDLIAEYAGSVFTSSDSFDLAGVNAVLARLEGLCHEFAQRSGSTCAASIDFVAEARYCHQVWHLDVPLRHARFESAAAVKGLVDDFHATHEQIYAIRDERADIEIVNLRARVICPFGRTDSDTRRVRTTNSVPTPRYVYFADDGHLSATITELGTIAPGVVVPGPAIIESSFTTVVLPPGACAERRSSGSIVVSPGASRDLGAGAGSAGRQDAR